MKTKFTSLIKQFAVTLVIGLAAITFLISNPSPAFAGSLIFYEGNNCTQDVAFTYDTNDYISDNCKETSRCLNDETRSLEIKGPAEYTTVEVYDDPDGARDDDFSVINIKSVDNGKSQCINTFESDLSTAGVEVYYGKYNGLDAKVSHINVMSF